VVPPSDDIDHEHRSLKGSPAEAIVDCAKEVGADFIVMGTHGRTGLARVLMGSVAEAVVRQAPCPVVTVKEHADEPAESKG
jgi:nucleotide-binding universal stress UspA family protein